MASTPKAPDPYAQAAAQQGAELGAAQGSAIINNPNEQNAYGSVNYTNAGYETIYDAKGNPQYVPRYTRTETLSPDQMKLLGLETQTKGNAGQAAVTGSAKLAEMMKTGIDPSKWQSWQMANAPGAVRQDQTPTDRAAVEEAMLSRYRETAGKQAKADDAQLAARGLNPGSQGYGNVADTRQRAMTDAQLQAFLASGEESRASQGAYNAAELQKYQMGSDYASFANQLRQAQQESDTALRSQPINEIASLMGMGQVTVPQFTPFSRQGINAAPVGQYVSDAYQNKLAAANAKNQGIFGLGQAAIGALPWSDRRLKSDIEPIGIKLAGLPLYQYRIGGEVQIGVMADETRQLHPDAVRARAGFDTVDYGLLHSRHEGV